MTKKTNLTPEVDLELDDLFAQARGAAPVPSANLLTRISDDARDVQADFQRVKTMPGRTGLAWLRTLFDDLGGAPALGGMVASACVGIYFGFANPDLATTWSSSEVVELVQTDGVMSHAMLGDLFWIEEG